MTRALALVVACFACKERVHDPLATRFTDARTSVTHLYAACVPAPDGACRVSAETRGGPADMTLPALPDDPDDRRHALALRDLRWAATDTAAGRRARTALERLVDARNAAAPADLAAAYVLESDATGSALPLLQAIEVLDRHDDGAAVTRFNRAVVLERLALEQEALNAWRAYRLLDSTSAWASEARQRERAIRQRWKERRDIAAAIAAPTPLVPSLAASEAVLNVDVVWRALLRAAAAHASARLEGASDDAGLARRRAETLAVALDAAACNCSAADPKAAPGTARSLIAAVTASRADSVLWRAHVALRRGLDALDDSDAEAALREFTSAASQFTRAGSAFDGWAQFYRAAALADLGQFGEADRIFQQLTARGERRLRARALTSLGVSAVRQGRYARAIDRYTAALDQLPRDRATHDGAFLHSLIAEARHLLGDDAGASVDALEAQRGLGRFREPGVLSGQLGALAEIARAEGLSMAATRVSRETVALVSQGASAVDKAWAFSGLACNLAAAGMAAPARAALDSAERTLLQVPAGSVREHIRALILTDNAPLIVRDARRDTTWIAQAERTLRRFRNGISLPLALQLSAERQLAVGDTAQADAILQRAVRSLDAQAQTMGSGSDRWRFDEAREATYDAVMRLSLRRGSSAAAFRWLEMLRGGDDAAAEVWTDRLRAALPTGAAVVSYLVLDDRLLIWVVGKTVDGVVERRVSRDTLGRYVDTVVGGRLNVGALQALDSLLLAPVARQLQGVTRLYVVPDRELGRVPFAALWDGSRFLVERTTPIVQASLTAVVRALAEPARREGPRRVLAVASEGDGAGEFETLPRAAVEAAAVARLYPDAIVLSGPDATIDRVSTGVRRAEILHFAGHAAVNLDHPERSFLQMAPAVGNTASSGRQWTVAAIAAAPTSSLDLVFLSACRTSGVRATHRVGTGSLASAFQRAGVGRVVSTLFEVGDGDAEVVATEFHRQLQRSGDAAGALRDSQLRALRSHPGVAWWAFVYSGA